MCHRKNILSVILSLILILNLLGCVNDNESNSDMVSEDQHISTNDSILAIKDTVFIEPIRMIDSLEQVLIDAGLVDVQDVDSSLLIDLRYTTTNNFIGKDVYGDLNRVYLQPVVAEDLKKCQAKLKSIDSSLTLLIYDGVRPRGVQQIMWDVLDMPINEKVKFVSNPKNGSIHNYGAAVDLTVAKLDGTPLDMGADFDDIRKIAYPRLEAQFLESGELTQEQVDNRKLLRQVMKAGGFYNIQTEWWHFNRYNRNTAKEMFEIVE